MTVTALRKQKITVGSLIDQMCTVRDQRRVLAEQDKALSATFHDLEKQLIELMDKEGLKKSTGHLATAIVSESVQFNPVGEDGWDKFMAYMAKNKLFHLVQRRLSAPSVRELFEKKGSVPGLEPFTKREISLRAVS